MKYFLVVLWKSTLCYTEYYLYDKGSEKPGGMFVPFRYFPDETEVFSDVEMTDYPCEWRMFDTRGPAPSVSLRANDGCLTQEAPSRQWVEFVSLHWFVHNSKHVGIHAQDTGHKVVE